MSKGGKIAIKVAIGVAVVALMGVVIKSWDRSLRYGVLDYGEEQLAEVRAGNHQWTDTLIYRALSFFMTEEREDGLRQIRIAQSADSMYWAVWHAESLMHYEDGNYELSMKYAQRALDLCDDENARVFLPTDTLTIAQAWLKVAVCYIERYKESGDDWELHFAEENIDVAEKCYMCWLDRQEADELRGEIETKKVCDSISSLSE